MEREHLPIVAIADDLTGALEIGGIFASRSVSAIVSTAQSISLPVLSHDVIVFDTETRHLPGEQAALQVRRLAAACRSHGVQRLYKKTDSTLRGNIGAEFHALLAAGIGDEIFYAPAYPALRRTVRRGCLFVDDVPVHESAFANDALDPVTESDIVRRLHPHVRARSASLQEDQRSRSPGFVHVFDGETEGDLKQVADFLAHRPGWVAAGPAGLARSVALHYGGARAPLRFDPRRVLVVNGSLHPVSKRQVEVAVEAGWETVGFGSSLSTRASSGWFVLEQPPCSAQVSPAHAWSQAPPIVKLVEDAGIDTLVIFGGDTAHAILKALGCVEAKPLGELLPGIPVSTVRNSDLTFVTKAGGFGDDNTLIHLRQRMNLD